MNKNLLDIKSEIFNALGVYELEESSRTPNGTKFWLDCQKAIDRYVDQALKAHTEALIARLPEKRPVSIRDDDKYTFTSEGYNEAIDMFLAALKDSDKERTND